MYRVTDCRNGETLYGSKIRKWSKMVNWDLGWMHRVMGLVLCILHHAYGTAFYDYIDFTICICNRSYNLQPRLGSHPRTRHLYNNIFHIYRTSLHILHINQLHTRHMCAILYYLSPCRYYISPSFIPPKKSCSKKYSLLCLQSHPQVLLHLQ